MTLIELLIALTITGALSALALPRIGAVWDRMAVERAGIELMSFYQTARFGAIQRARPVRIVFREDSLIANLSGLADSTFLARPGPGAHGVRLTVSRDEIAFYPNGAALGAANTKLILRRGRAVDSITTSRLGRLKRWR